MGMGHGTEQGSTTALGVLSLACLAGSERDSDVRLDDPVAPGLLRWRDGRMATAKLKPLHPLLRRAVERSLPGSYGYTIARTRHIDGILAEQVAAGLDSVVILGAGYDTRAYRLRDLLDGVPVFEVDHPATSREKRARLARAIGAPPPGVAYVEADFTRHHLLARLADHGHELSQRTLFVLSGVSPFLAESAVLELFDQVAGHTSPRTSLLFDYVFADVLDDPARYYGGPEWEQVVTGVDEEPRHGFPRGEVGAALGAHGLRLASDVGPEELSERYLRRADGTQLPPPFGFWAIAHAYADA